MICLSKGDLSIRGWSVCQRVIRRISSSETSSPISFVDLRESLVECHRQHHQLWRNHHQYSYWTILSLHSFLAISWRNKSFQDILRLDFCHCRLPNFHYKPFWAILSHSKAHLAVFFQNTSTVTEYLYSSLQITAFKCCFHPCHIYFSVSAIYNILFRCVLASLN